jgi:hypothetical protein
MAAFSPPPGILLKMTRSDAPLYEFFSFMLEETLERLKLPDRFT